MKIRTRLEYFVALLVGESVDIGDITPCAPINATEELLVKIGKKISGEENDQPMQKEIRTRFDHFLAKIAGMDVDFTSLAQPRNLTTVELILLAIAIRINGGTGVTIDSADLRTREEFFLANVAGVDVDFDKITPSKPINTIEELLMGIAEKLDENGGEDDPEDPEDPEDPDGRNFSPIFNLSDNILSKISSPVFKFNNFTDWAGTSGVNGMVVFPLFEGEDKTTIDSWTEMPDRMTIVNKKAMSGYPGFASDPSTMTDDEYYVVCRAFEEIYTHNAYDVVVYKQDVIDKKITGFMVGFGTLSTDYTKFPVDHFKINGVDTELTESHNFAQGPNTISTRYVIVTDVDSPIEIDEYVEEVVIADDYDYLFDIDATSFQDLFGYIAATYGIIPNADGSAGTPNAMMLVSEEEYSNIEENEFSLDSVINLIQNGQYINAQTLTKSYIDFAKRNNPDAEIPEGGEELARYLSEAAAEYGEGYTLVLQHKQIRDLGAVGYLFIAEERLSDDIYVNGEKLELREVSVEEGGSTTSAYFGFIPYDNQTIHMSYGIEQEGDYDYLFDVSDVVLNVLFGSQYGNMGQIPNLVESLEGDAPSSLTPISESLYSDIVTNGFGENNIAELTMNNEFSDVSTYTTRILDYFAGFGISVPEDPKDTAAFIGSAFGFDKEFILQQKQARKLGIAGYFFATTSDDIAEDVLINGRKIGTTRFEADETRIWWALIPYENAPISLGYNGSTGAPEYDALFNIDKNSMTQLFTAENSEHGKIPTLYEDSEAAGDEVPISLTPISATMYSKLETNGMSSFYDVDDVYENGGFSGYQVLITAYLDYIRNTQPGITVPENQEDIPAFIKNDMGISKFFLQHKQYRDNNVAGFLLLSNDSKVVNNVKVNGEILEFSNWVHRDIGITATFYYALIPYDLDSISIEYIGE